MSVYVEYSSTTTKLPMHYLFDFSNPGPVSKIGKHANPQH